MKTKLARFFILAAMMVLTSVAFASKPVFNQAYVQSGPSGVFYARCLPEGTKGTKGTEGVTEIYSVNKEGDQLVDRYDWYARGGVVLGWSPIAGKVSVLAIHRREPDTPERRRMELKMYLGGKVLREWTMEELAKLWPKNERALVMGADVFTVVGCQQIPNTNEYVYVIEVDGQRVSFDILTGEVYGK